MTITISGREGEGKTCIANIIREALESAGVHAGGFGEGGIPFFESAVAADMLADRVEVKVVEVFGEVLP